MTRRVFCLALGLASAAALSAGTGPAVGQGKADPNRPDHPRLRAALQEMREARTWVQESRVNWPEGLKERAVHHLNLSIDAVRAILKVKDVNTFVGYDRNKDYYGRFRDNPELRSALADVRDARDEIRGSKIDDFGDQKDYLLDNLDVVAGDLVVLIRNNPPRKK